MAGRKNNQIKKPGQEVEYTYEQLQELKRCMLDPAYFIRNYVLIQHPVKGTVPFDLYDFQEEMIETYHKNDSVIVLSSRQTGKMLPLDTKLPTPSGWTTMGDITIGDVVIGADGYPTTVTWISDIETPEVAYELSFDTGEKQVACSEHEWEVEQKYKKSTRVLTTQQMVDFGVSLDKNESRFKIKTTTPLILPELELPIDPYTLGVWLGDGTSRTGEITTHSDDLEIYEYVDQHYDRNQRCRPSDNNTYTTTLYGLRTKLSENKLIQNKHIPLTYLRASYNQRLALLQGLMDTDGYVDGMGRGQCDITLADHTLAMDVFHLACTLGLKCSFKERLVGKFVRHEIKFSAYSDEIEVFRLKRKLNNMKKSPHYLRKNSTKKRSIQKIERVPSTPMKCIGVDNKDKLYLFGDACIPTHNSITSAAYLLWFATFNFDKTILIASNKNDNAMEMIFRIRFAYESLPFWLKAGVLEDGWNKHNVFFDNGSRIISTATSEESGRGLAISLLFLDEFAFVSPAVQEEFWTSIAPTLSTGGSCIITSTPNGDTNIFANLWRGAQVDANGFIPIRVKWDQPPGRDEEFKEKQIGKLGIRKWMQEYECEFLSSDALLIDTLFLTNMAADIKANGTPISRIGKLYFWEEIKKNGTYLVGVDPATGSGEDFSVITVWEFPSLKQVAEYRSNTLSTADVYSVLKNLLLFIEAQGGSAYFSIENNGVGEGLITLYEKDETPPENSLFVSEDGNTRGKPRLGMTTTAKNKMRACVNLKEMVERGILGVRSPVLYSELKTFIRRRGAYAAQDGSTDDCISAVLIIIRLMEEMASYDQTAYDKLYTREFDKWEDGDMEFGDYDDTDLGLGVLV